MNYKDQIEIEKKAEEYAKNKILILGRYNTDIQQSYKDGYKQGQKDYCNLGMTILPPKTYNEFSAKIRTIEKENEELKMKLSYFNSRFVICSTCNEEQKSKCLMFTEGLCEGERCNEVVDIINLVEQSDLRRENEELKAQIEKMKCCGNCQKTRKATCDDNKRVIAIISRQCDEWELAE